MPCSWRASDRQLLLILTVFLVAESISAGVEESVTSSNSTQLTASFMDEKQNDLKPNTEAGSAHVKAMKSLTPTSTTDNAYMTALVGQKAQLVCPTRLLENVVLTTWVIHFRNNSSCIRAHKTDKTETTRQNCTDERMTWPSKPDQNSTLQIDSVAISHEGYYTCDVASPAGNFHYNYHLRVLVAPEVTLLSSKNRTAVCKAIAGKPAAQISWTPEGDCVPECKSWDNGTVTVQSTCHWADSNVSVVFCSVSHETGNGSWPIELNQGAETLGNLRILYIILPIFITLVIVGSIWHLKITGCRKCKWKRTEPTAVVEDDMQPYASYTEKSNPLYDTTKRVKPSQALQCEVHGVNPHTL